MKIAIPLLLFIPFFGIAQKPYVDLTAISFNYSHADTYFGGSLAAGYKTDQIIGVGAGIAITNFKGSNALYLPMFGEFCFYSDRSVIRPYGVARVGYGYFNQPYFGYKTKGGLYYSPGVGILFPVKTKFDISILGSFVSSDFSNTLTKTTSTSRGWTVELGVKF